MKPTTELISSARRHAESIRDAASEATVFLSMAGAYYESDCENRAASMLEAARAELCRLRRTQTAALENIDAALESIKGGAK